METILEGVVLVEFSIENQIWLKQMNENIHSPFWWKPLNSFG